MRKLITYINSCDECPHNSDRFCELLDIHLEELHVDEDGEPTIPEECPLDYSISSLSLSQRKYG